MRDPRPAWASGAKGQIPQGLDGLWARGLGVIAALRLTRNRLLRHTKCVLALEQRYNSMTDARLRQEIEDLRVAFRLGRDTYEDWYKAFAILREVAWRQIGQLPYPVQVMGGWAIASGAVAEMATGEGKTLTATMPATIAGWRGRGCHIVTVNDYLARRDAEWMEPIYRFCGLQVGYIEQGMGPADRRAAYAADITYCTNKEVCADFLRDRLLLASKGGQPSWLEALLGGKGSDGRLVQRGLYQAIVDEADSVLIDEAVTPLIISSDTGDSQQVEAFRQAADLVCSLSKGLHYQVDMEQQDVELTDEGIWRLQELTAGWGGIWRIGRCRNELAVKALLAKEIYGRDKQYIVDQDKVVIVDDFTGRLMPDRQWRDGLHQAVEAKERLEVTAPKETLARISFQRFFRLYRSLAGMTGTAREAVGEFWLIYGLPVAVIPPNRPCIRQYWPDVVLTTEQAKWAWIVREIAKLNKIGRPVLVGTRTIRSSEFLSNLLAKEGIRCQVLNAIRHKEEAQIVSAAGQLGQVTIATNMAGRGTDIKLGRGVPDLGGLHVIAAERNESGRIDRQLFGRCARQGDPGSCQAIISLEDELFVRYASRLSSFVKLRYGPTDRNIASPLTSTLVALAQSTAQRRAYRLRKAVIRMDHWLDEQLSFAAEYL
ncbi:MAG: helicase-related protein [Sedimentisphaerales bacterium]|nr:helicase-related protein [Sedimentisphaerales bacterium]